jgi:hypothetical protein
LPADEDDSGGGGGAAVYTPTLLQREPSDYFPVVEHENWNIPSKNVK